MPFLVLDDIGCDFFPLYSERFFPSQIIAFWGLGSGLCIFGVPSAQGRLVSSYLTHTPGMLLLLQTPFQLVLLKLFLFFEAPLEVSKYLTTEHLNTAVLIPV